MTTRNMNLDDRFRDAVHRESVSEQIVERILSLIREQQLRPGDRLPAERELSTLMKVSRATVREALRSLAMMNVVDLRHGSGTYVTSLEPQLLVENLGLVFSLTDSSFLALIEARKVIEPGATALAALRITDEQIAQLDDVIARSWECHRTAPATFPEFDVEFHARIAEFSQNVLLTRIMQALSQMSMASSQRTAQTGSDVDPARVERAIRMHEGILAALREHDAPLASQRMVEHLTAVEDTLRGVR